MLDRRLLRERRFHCLSRVNLRRQLEMACIPNNMALNVGVTITPSRCPSHLIWRPKGRCDIRAVASNQGVVSNFHVRVRDLSLGSHWPTASLVPVSLGEQMLIVRASCAPCQELGSAMRLQSKTSHTHQRAWIHRTVAALVRSKGMLTSRRVPLPGSE